MSIEIIDILKPKNGLSFKLIEDIDIAVSGYTSLADAVAHFATKEGVISAINLALSGKQDALTEQQLAAVNSGITAQLVTQIGTNTTAIAGKADAADLTALSAEVNTKADDSDIASLQAQIDNIVSGSTADSEVINARVDVDGTNHATLKARCDADDAKHTTVEARLDKVAGDLIDYGSLITGKYISGYGVQTDLANNNCSGFVEVEAGKKVTIDGVNVSGSRAVCGYDKNQVYVVCFATNDSTKKTLTVEIPQTVKYIRFTCAPTQSPVMYYSNYLEYVDSNDTALKKLINNKYDDVLTVGALVEGKYIDSSGGEAVSADSECTDFIEVIGGKYQLELKNVSFSGSRTLCCYNNSKTFIKVLSATSSGGSYITDYLPSEAKYIRASALLGQTPEISYYNKLVEDIAPVEMINPIIKALNYGEQVYDEETTYQLGYIHGRNYNNPNSSQKTAYSNLFETIGPVTVKCINGYKAIVCYIDEDKDCDTFSAWTDTSDNQITVNPPTSYFAIEVRKIDESDITAADINANVKTTTSLGGYSASLCYVQTTGNDSNDGTTRATAFKTIQKAIDSGFKNILVREGVYNEAINMQKKTGITITLDHNYDTFTAGTDEDNPKIIIDGTSNSLTYGVKMTDCHNCNISNIEVRNLTGKGFEITKCDNLKFKDCIVHDNGVGATTGSIGGFVLMYTDADFDNCVAYNIGTNTVGTGTYHYDGFNIHGTGTTNFYNCKAWNCEDDGISHHDACCGLIDGGEYYNCGKGGVASPTHGAKINVSNVYCHDNQIGIYASNDNAVTDRGNIIFSNCVCKDNTYRDMFVGSYYNVIAINCVYDTISGSEYVTRFGITN